MDNKETVIIEGREVQQENMLASFEALLDARIIRAVKDMGFTKLTPIQEQAIPCLLEGRDIIGQAQTGTGKTAAFGIPMLQRIDANSRKLQAIVLCPTRELAMQAAEELRKLAKYMHGIKVLPIYGGQDINRQIAGLKGVQIIVGTPGRVMDHMRRHTIKMESVKMVVLDEADEMLNMGFREDMELILGEIQGEHQTALFSATMPQPILEITGKFQTNAKRVRVAAKELTIPLVSQKYFRVKSEDKDAATVRLLEYYQPNLCLIFCNTKKKVDELTDRLKEGGFRVESLHGDLTQYQRDIAMNRFRGASTNILIATDVAARGIDVDDVEIVLNYDLPQDIEYYVHRIGRTGRAGKTGISLTLVSGREIYRLREIERVCRTKVEEQKIPNTRNVFRAKAFKTLERVMAYKDSEDLEMMKRFIQKKMEDTGCEAIDIAAAFLKEAIGDLGENIDEDDFVVRSEEELRKERRDGRGRRGEWIGSRFGRSRDGRRSDGEGRDSRRRGTEGRDGRRMSAGGRDGRRREAEGRDGRRMSAGGRDDRRRDAEGRGGRHGDAYSQGDRRRDAEEREGTKLPNTAEAHGERKNKTKDLMKIKKKVTKQVGKE